MSKRHVDPPETAQAEAFAIDVAFLPGILDDAWLHEG
jgi:hypothetical protein